MVTVIDAATAQTHLDAWLAASLAVARGQSYRIGERELTRADAAEIRKMIDYWSRLVNAASATRSSIRLVTPIT